MIYGIVIQRVIIKSPEVDKLDELLYTYMYIKKDCPTQTFFQIQKSNTIPFLNQKTMTIFNYKLFKTNRYDYLILD